MVRKEPRKLTPMTLRKGESTIKKGAKGTQPCKGLAIAGTHSFQLSTEIRAKRSSRVMPATLASTWTSPNPPVGSGVSAMPAYRGMLAARCLRRPRTARGLERGVNEALVGHVAHKVHVCGAGFAGGRGKPGYHVANALVPVYADHVRPGAGERLSDGLADARRGSRDQRNAACLREHASGQSRHK